MILFLDFDGVLHPDEVFLEQRRPVLRAEGKLFMWADLLAEALSNHPDVKLVLSTSWARELGFARARSYLPAALRDRVIGATWHSEMLFDEEYRSLGGRQTWWDQATRYQQIKRYVNRTALTDWIAIDDQAEGWSDADSSRLIQTDGAKGLSDPTALSRLSGLLRLST